MQDEPLNLPGREGLVHGIHRVTSRRGWWLSAATALAATVLGAHASWATPGKDPPIAPGGITLKQALEKGLKARRPSEFAYINMVVELVEDGVLPRALVERTFLYARSRSRSIPMPYFEKALQIQARKLGIDLPFTDT